MAVSSNISGPSGNERQLIDAALRDAEQLAQMDVAFAPPPDSFTGYTILREVHRGGQGVVYQAVQESTSRKVAIKVLREGPFASEADRARFGREVEILGQLNHPSIVAIHDTGVGAGHHFLVMDYISGQPLDVYMASGERSVDETLRLFATICEAVNAAHLRGVIHRDLKPSNVRIDAEGVPHVLDFGLARITISGGGDNGPARAKTMTGQFVGSLPWAAPEQAEGVPSKIDMRTDVYSLGVILYQMLTGKFPYEVMGNMRDVLDRIMKAVPARPSTVRRQINDEVETIVLKCLQKQPERRYQSAGELARDVHRYLTGEPIEAKRDSTAYVLRKQLRKHRVPVAFAAVFIVVVTAGFVVSLAFWRQAVEQRDSAEQARVAEAEQRRVAEVNEAKAQQATQFIQQMLSGIDPEIAGGLDKTLMRMILDDAAAKIETELVGQPEVEASIRATIGSTYQAIGEYPLAQAQLEQGLEIRQRVLGEEHPDTLHSMNDVAVLYHEQGRYTEAEPLLLRALEISKRVLGQEHPDTLKTTLNLGSLYYEEGRYAEAEPLLFRALDSDRRVLGEEHPATLASMNDLGLLYYDQGRYAETERLFARALESRQRVLGVEHPDTLKTMNNLGLLYLDQGRYAEAEPLLAQVLEIRKRVLGEEHPHTLLSMNSLAALYQKQGRYDEAEPLFLRALEINKRVLGEEHPNTLGAMNNLASIYLGQGRYAEAEPLLVRLLEIVERVLGEEHPNTLASMSNLASLYQEQGRYTEAEPLLGRALEINEHVLGEEHSSTLALMNKLGGLYAATDRLAEAEALLAKAVDGARRSQEAGHPTIGKFLTDYGACLTRLERYGEAEAALLEAHQTLVAALGPAHKTTIKSVRFLIALYDAWGKPDLAAVWQAKLDTANPPGSSGNGR